MKKYNIRIVNYSSLDVEANSKEEAIKKANEVLDALDRNPDRFPENLTLSLLPGVGSGWEVDDEAEE